MQRYIKLILTTFIFTILLNCQVLYSQNVVVTANIDSSQILIGDQPNLTINVSAPKNYNVIWPAFKDTLSKNVEIIKAYKIDTTINNADNKVNYNQKIKITSFDAGNYTFSFVIPYLKEKDTNIYFAESNLTYLYINTVPTDTTMQIKGIKGIIAFPLTIYEFVEYAYYFITALLAIAIVLLIIEFVKKLKKHSIQSFFEIQKPAHEIALNELKKLKAKKLWQNNEYKLYYSELCDITKNYLERRFKISAPEMTTEELIPAIKKMDIPEEVNIQLIDLFKSADLVKFAKAIPTANENEDAFAIAENTVIKTIPTITNVETSKS